MRHKNVPPKYICKNLFLTQFSTNVLLILNEVSDIFLVFRNRSREYLIIALLQVFYKLCPWKKN